MKGLIFAAIAILIATADAVLVNPLPKPQYIAWNENSGPITLSKSFRITTPKNIILEEAAQRTVHTIWKEQWVPVAVEKPIPIFPAFPPATGSLNKRAPYEVHGITVKVDDLKADLQHGVDEWYELVINASGGSIHAHTVWGALRAFETLNQIVIGTEEHNGHVWIEHPVHIKDWANYPHRGLLLDTGRNFYPVSAILRTIDALAWSKLNVLHWHIDDSQSWPLQLSVYPEMTKDAYSKREIYSYHDVKTIVQYARARGVRVIPEIDAPGHSAAGWKQVDPQAVACANSWWDNDEWTHHSAVEPTPGQLDIAYEPTYEILKNVYDEVADLFPDTAYHAGFDELQKYCYNYSSHVNNWFKANPTLGYTDLAQYYLDKALPIFQSKKKHVIMWEDIVKTDTGFNANNVDKSVILQSWNYGTANIKLMTSLGHQVIVSSSDWFYLDCGFGGFVSNDKRYDVDANPDPNNPSFNFGLGGGSWCAPYKTWQRIYDYDFTFNLTVPEAKLVIGAEVAMWSEQSDATVVDSKVWPRAAALAESLWSGNRNATGFKRYNEFTQRINDFRERLVARGVGASPLMPRYCLQHPHTCDLFLQQ